MDIRMNIRSHLFPLVILSMIACAPVSAQNGADSRIRAEELPKELRLRLNTLAFENAVAGKVSQKTMLSTSLFEPATVGASKKSAFIGVLYSFLLPGMGEIYAERSDRVLAPLITEAALWLGVVGFNAYGTSIQHDARLYAHIHAGVDQSGKTDQFFVDIGNYSDVYQYNDYRLVERNLGAIYDINNPSFLWKWDSDANRVEYKDQRIKSDRMYNTVSFFIVGLIANRIWSAIETAVFVKNYNKSITALERLPSMRSELTSSGGRIDGVRLLFSKSF